jgi:hypothetical protein
VIARTVVVVGVGALGGVWVGCWKDVRKEVGREGWWWMDVGRGEAME